MTWDGHHWRERALCASQRIDLRVFYPDVGENADEAKRVCVPCPVKLSCLNEAMRRVERFGVWGGLSARERSRLRKLAEEPVSEPEQEEVA